jgi:hypothetical protein
LAGDAKNIVERRGTRGNQRGNALRVLGIRNPFKQPIRGSQNWERHLRPIHEWRKAFVVPFAGLAEQNGFDAAAGAQRFLDEADAFDAYATRFGLRLVIAAPPEFGARAFLAALTGVAISGSVAN